MVRTGLVGYVVSWLGVVGFAAAGCSRSVPVYVAARDAGRSGADTGARPADAAAEADAAGDGAAERCVPEDVDDDLPSDDPAQRDRLRVQRLLLQCLSGEDCAGAYLDVADDGLVSAVRATDTSADRACPERVLRDLCLPGLAGLRDEELSVCGL